MADARDGHGAGFTLIETLVAFTILAVIMTAVFRGFGQGSNSLDAAELRIEALVRAEALLAQVSTAPLPAPMLRQDGPWQESVTVSRAQLPGLLRVQAQVLRDRRTTTLVTLVPQP